MEAKKQDEKDKIVPGEAVTEGAKAEKEIILSDGRKAEIFEGKGIHALRAQRQCEGNQNRYFSALMSMLIKIEGKHYPAEDFEQMKLGDFVTLQAEFTEKNF